MHSYIFNDFTVWIRILGSTYYEINNHGSPMLLTDAGEFSCVVSISSWDTHDREDHAHALHYAYSLICENL